MGNFQIAESDAFLSASLSLSFGVMLFSALYSMLPSSKKYLISGGYSPQAASYLLIGLFLGGVIAIQILSRVLHHFIPSHVVDCDHTHDEEHGNPQEEMEEHHHNDEYPNELHGAPIVTLISAPEEDDEEDTPLLSREHSYRPPKPRTLSAPQAEPVKEPSQNGLITTPSTRRPTLMPRRLTQTFTRLAAGRKSTCDETGPCMGYSEPCGQECFTGMTRRGSILPGSALSRQYNVRRKSSAFRFAHPIPQSTHSSEATDSLLKVGRSRATTNGSARSPATRSRSATHHYHHPNNQHLDHKHADDSRPRRGSTTSSHSMKGEHHHHVATNAFLLIGLQTSLAIALHKAPEGFITYATNHANPKLGFAVFMALFIHNITEGFALALPLYLALGSRVKAMVWSSFLGGASQPVGAGVAAMWFKIAKGGDGHGAPGEGVYGGMFAVTAGVMTSVALSLFSESLALSHNKNICIGFAFLGMGILGISFALTA